jgi:protein arginine kinase activator
MSPVLCQSCGQNPATIHFTEIRNDQKRELHICEACANEQGLGGGAPIPAILSNLVQGVKRTAPDADLACPTCGITFEEFRAKGRLGCPKDYEVFEEAMGPLLERIHGSRRHAGRLPKGRVAMGSDLSDRLLRLRRDLQQAVDGEKYETAAQLRDEIRRLEGREEALPARTPKRKGKSRGSQ